MLNKGDVRSQPDNGNIILYTFEDGKDAVEVRLANETVWLTQTRNVKLFKRNQSVISRHVNNFLKQGELGKESNMQEMHIAHSDKPVAFYNFDVIISDGYRVKSKRDTQFRIRATRVIKEHLVQGVAANQKRFDKFLLIGMG